MKTVKIPAIQLDSGHLNTRVEVLDADGNVAMGGVLTSVQQAWRDYLKVDKVQTTVSIMANGWVMAKSFDGATTFVMVEGWT